MLNAHDSKVTLFEKLDLPIPEEITPSLIEKKKEW